MTLYSFTKTQLTLMEILGCVTAVDKDRFYEGFVESKLEQQANGIPTTNFDTYLSRQVTWQVRKQTAMQAA